MVCSLPAVYRHQRISNSDCIGTRGNFFTASCPFNAIVSAKDPGYANWICTGGLKIGMITVRWNEKEGEEHMEAKLVSFQKISEAMPAKSAKVNPEDRQLLLQDLRSHILRRYGR